MAARTGRVFSSSIDPCWRKREIGSLSSAGAGFLTARILRKDTSLQNGNAIGSHEPQTQGDTTRHRLLSRGKLASGSFVNAKQFLNVACRHSCDHHGRAKLRRCHVAPRRDFKRAKSWLSLLSNQGQSASSRAFVSKIRALFQLQAGGIAWLENNTLDLAAEHRDMKPMAGRCRKPVFRAW